MEMDEKQMTKIMIGVAVVIALGVGTFTYHTHKVNAQEAASRQAEMVQIDKQKEQEKAAQEAKAGAPVVSAAPSSIVPKEPQKVAETSTSQSANQEPVQAITVLSDSDIQHLQSYPQYSGNNGVSSAYHSFKDMYVNNRASCDKLLQVFTPITLSKYNNAKVEWLTSPRLIYRNAISQYCIRGIVSITYYGSNSFGLTPNVTYQREVEYRLRNTDQLRLENTNYLSDFKAVK